MLPIARRTATLDQRKAFAEVDALVEKPQRLAPVLMARVSIRAAAFGDRMASWRVTV
jgi:hypothetical protein